MWGAEHKTLQSGEAAWGSAETRECPGSPVAAVTGAACRAQFHTLDILGDLSRAA